VASYGVSDRQGSSRGSISATSSSANSSSANSQLAFSVTAPQKKMEVFGGFGGGQDIAVATNRSGYTTLTERPSSRDAGAKTNAVRGMPMMHIPDDAQHQSYADVGIGDRVTVSGYQGAGFVRFIGVINTQRTDGKVRLGVELDLPNGKHDGTVGGHAYFSCAAKHGLLVPRERVGLLAHNNVLSDGYVGVDGASGHIGHSNAPTDADGFGFNPVDPARIDDENSLSDSDV